MVKEEVKVEEEKKSPKKMSMFDIIDLIVFTTSRTKYLNYI